VRVNAVDVVRIVIDHCEPITLPRNVPRNVLRTGVERGR
jgi:hypothetical protein